MTDLTDFDLVNIRSPFESIKWHYALSGAIAMTVADMEFKTPLFIREAIQQELDKGILGYNFINDTFYDAICKWHKQQHNSDIDNSYIIATTGVIPTLKAIITGSTKIGDKILIQEPVYHTFKKTILEIKRTPEINVLDVNNGSYTINFADLEQRLQDGVKIFVLCSPHNPIGKVWEQQDIIRIAELCLKHKVLLISDEIHADLCMPGQSFYSALSMPEDLMHNLIVLSSPNKTFNCAGLHGGYAIISNPDLRDKAKEHINFASANAVNTLFITAATAAYNYGNSWKHNVVSYIHQNYLYLCEYLHQHMPYLKISKLQATYLVWINYASLNIDENTFAEILAPLVAVIPGSIFGESGQGYFRINIACPRSVLQEALFRIIKVLPTNS